MPPDPRATALLDMATEDLAAARNLLDGFPRQAAFHVGQAAEKMSKAILVQDGISHPMTTHDIDRLIGCLPDGHVWRADLSGLGCYSAYNTRFRYPGPTGRVPAPPDVQTLRRDIDVVARLLPEIRDWLTE